MRDCGLFWRRALWVIAGCAIGSLGPMHVSAAEATPLPVLDIPGLAARQISVAGVGRLDDGGALVAGTVSSGSGARTGRVAVVRLQADGTVDLSYGDAGISTVGLHPGVRATSMAIDPRTGQSWVGVAIGFRGDGAVIAFDPSGHRRMRFGHAGALQLRTAGAGGPAALAWRRGALLVAAGRLPCRGCNVSIRDPASGALLAARGLTQTDLSGSAGCVGSTVTSAAFAPRRQALIATRSAGHTGCGARVLVFKPTSTAARDALKTMTVAAFRPPIVTSAVSAFVTRLCVAGASRSATEVGPFVPGRQFAPSARGPSGNLLTVVPLGGGACATLVASIHRSGGFVVQAAAGEQHRSLIFLPRGVQALGMFRCHQHLLVIGSRPAAAGRAGVIVVVPLRRGIA
jgi:hypothetical protein